MTPLIQAPLLLALLALPLAAQSGPGRGPRSERIGQALQLTEPQKASLQAIREKHRSALITTRDAVQHARIDLRTALRDPAIPDAQLRALYDKASSARFELILAQRSLRREVQALLTPQQRAKAAELRGRARAGMREDLRHRRQSEGMAG
jgi:Spy/CpxP family protein refolding chaperone